MNAVANKLYVMGGYQKISDEEVSHSPSEVTIKPVVDFREGTNLGLYCRICVI